ncbi:hypothetical protein SARC_04987, partial [Sphaeroforma arctica JP610]
CIFINRTILGLDMAYSTFIEPVRSIRTNADLACFLESAAFDSYVNFVVALGDSVRGIKTSQDIFVPEVCEKIIDLLNKFREFFDVCPPTNTQSRFGNPSFTKWSAMVKQ